MKQKIIARLLSICMIFSLIPAAAFAAEEPAAGKTAIPSLDVEFNLENTFVGNELPDMHRLTVRCGDNNADLEYLDKLNTTIKWVYGTDPTAAEFTGKTTQSGVYTGLVTISITDGNETYAFTADTSSYMLNGKQFTVNEGKTTLTGTVTLDLKRIIRGNLSTAGGTVSFDREEFTDIPVGTVVTVTVKPDEGYELEKLSVYTESGADVPVTDGKFTMPEESVSYSATFKEMGTYRVDLNLDMETSSLVSVSGTYFKPGETVTVTVTPNDNYALDKIVVTDASGNTVPVASDGTFAIPESDVTVSVSFTELRPMLHRINWEMHGDNGTFDVAETAMTGDEVTITATPDSGYEVTFTVVDVNGNPVTVTDGKFTMPACDVNIIFTFKEIPANSFTISVVSGIIGGTLVTDPAEDTYVVAGTEVTVTPKPEAGYELVRMYMFNPDVGTESDITATGKFIMPESNVIVNAEYKPAGTYKINLNLDMETGNLVSVSGTHAKPGETVTVTVTSDENYALDRIVVTDANGNAVPVASNNTFTMPASDVTLSVLFTELRPMMHMIGWEMHGDNGTIDVAETAMTGDEVTITAIPDPGYEITFTVVDARGNTVPVTNGKFIMPACDVNIIFTFRAVAYTVTVNAGANGTASAPATATMGQTVTVIAEPVGNYKVTTPIVTTADGRNVTVQANADGKTFTFIMPAGNVTVSVSFLSSAIVIDELTREEVQTPDLPNASESEKALAENVVQSINNGTVAADNLASAIEKELAQDNVTTDDGKPITPEAARAALGDKLAEGEEVVILVKPYLDMQVKSANTEALSVTIDIKPMYNIIAAIKDNENDTTKQTEMGKKTADTTGIAVTVTVPLPENMIEAISGSGHRNWFARHDLGNGRYAFHRLAADTAAKVVSFVNPLGFCDITMPLEINKTVNVSYTVGSDTKTFILDAETQSLTLKDALGTPAYDPNTQNFNGWKFFSDEACKTPVTGAAGTYPETSTWEALFDALTAADTVYAKADIANKGGSQGGNSGGSGSGGGASSGSNHAISVGSPANGKISVTPANAGRGTSVTINLTPDAGYVVGTVTVTDANGNRINVTRVNDTRYTFTMPAGRVTVNATFVRADADMPFTDVANGEYYYDAVLWAVANGITTGTSETRFSPNVACTRAQIVTFLWRAAGSPVVTGSNPFTDVASNEYYYNAVLWAVRQGITTGTSASSFSPNATCNRAQTVTFLYRYAGSPAVSGSSSFGDVAAGEYYTSAVNWAVAQGVTNGTSTNAFSPANDCTRGHVVTFLYRYMGD